MPKTLQSSEHPESFGRSISAPALFSSFPVAIQNELRKGAIPRTFSDGQIVQHRGDTGDGFWLIERGQIKLGHYSESGEMQALLIMGPGDSFGELACLARLPRVLDGEAIGTLDTLWISDAALSALISDKPAIARDLLGAMSKQLQNALDQLIMFRNMPAPKRLAQSLLSLTQGREAPVRFSIRQQELAELVGVSRMTIVSALTMLDELGLVSRHYRHLIIHDLAALEAWMLS